MCPNCEHHFRVIWPEPLPNHYHLCSKIKIKCPDCQEVTEVYDFLIDRIMCAPDPSIPTVDVLSISPRDPNPDLMLAATTGIWSWACREARYRATYRPVK
jgi:hypothetical protein